jgi:hypothetical protein
MKRSFMPTKGVAIVLVLLLISAIFILSAGFLSKKVSERKSVLLEIQTLQARELAKSGLETVRVRLRNDGNFPPSQPASTTEAFSFSEVVLDIDQLKPVGRYTAELDQRWIEPPYAILRVRVTGQVGTENNPVRYRMTGDFLMAPGSKGDLVNLSEDGDF